MAPKRINRNGLGRRSGRGPTGHSPVLTRLSLVELLLSRARLCFTEQVPRYESDRWGQVASGVPYNGEITNA